MDTSRLTQKVHLLEAQNKHLLEANKRLLAKIEELTYGRPGTLLPDEAQTPAPASTPAHGPRSERRGRTPPVAPSPPKTRQDFGPTPQPQLEVVDTLALLDEPDRVCPQCGDTLREMKGQFEQSEVIDHIPERYIRRRILRQKYVCKCGECVETACAPIELACERSRYSLEFALSVAQAKYLDHLPLDRQARQMKRAGLVVTTTVLFDLLMHLVRLANPTYDALPAAICARSEVVGMDESTWPLLEKGRQTWKILSLNCAEAVYYQIAPSATGEVVRELLEGFEGVVQSDGSAIYRRAQKLLTPESAEILTSEPSPPFELAGCWAHARRKFLAAEADFPAASEALALIGELYGIEKEAQNEAHRGELRVSRSVEVVERLEGWRRRVVTPSGSSLEKALAYLKNQWDTLTVFLRNPQVSLDNNASERSLRGPILGRKNHYGSKSERGTQVATVLYSLCESAKLSGVDPKRYLRAIVRAARARPGAVVLPWDVPDDPPPD